jgi:hypothetical protein
LQGLVVYGSPIRSSISLLEISVADSILHHSKYKEIIEGLRSDKMSLNDQLEFLSTEVAALKELLQQFVATS